MRMPEKIPSREQISRNSPLKYPRTAKRASSRSKIRSTILTVDYVGLDSRQ